ncbi:MAG TPA: inorganic pyrophosphatase [Vicinamibacteria bacterium]|nr:inorganic pyrophosphatase [Vicinamibacteria bacterium]
MPAAPRLGFRAHPWHGVSMGEEAPRVVTAYIEIVPTDTVKYEMDKTTGILRMDRPQQYSNVCPSLYGFLPRTLCAERVGALCADRTGRSGIVGDGDPMDVCVLTEKEITHGDILVRAIPIGGLSLIDGNEADDKILAVLQDDAVFGSFQDVSECPPPLVDRLRHYFLTYKQGPERKGHVVEIAHVYGRDEAHRVIGCSQEDYRHHLPELAGGPSSGGGG